MKRSLATLLAASVFLAAPGTSGWAQVVRTAAPAAPAAPVTGAAAAAPGVVSLGLPSLAAPGLGAAAPVLPSIPLPTPVLGPSASASGAARAAAVTPAPAGLSAAPAAFRPAFAAPVPAAPSSEAAAPAFLGTAESPAAASKSFKAVMAALSLPSSVSPGASGSGSRASAEQDFARRVTGEPLSRAAEAIPAGGVQSARAASGLSRPQEGAAAPVRGAMPAAPARTDTGVRHRSVYFPLTLAAAAGALFAVLTLGPAAFNVFSSWLPGALGALNIPATGTVAATATVFAAAAGIAAAMSAAYAAWEAALFTFAVAKRAPVSDEEFWRFVRKEVRRWNLHPSVTASLLGTGPGRGLLKVWRPAQPFEHLSFAFTQAGSIWLRPELARTPWLFRWVLRHELAHYAKDKGRGPPQDGGLLRRGWDFLSSELDARIKEWTPKRTLSSLRIPVLERVLHDAHISLDLGHEYDALIVHPGSHETRNPQTYIELSGGKARMLSLETGAPAEARSIAMVSGAASRREDQLPAADRIIAALGAKGYGERFRLIVYPQSFGALPSGETPESLRLQSALRKLDELSLLRQKLAVSGPSAFADGTPEGRRFGDLAAETLGRRGREKPKAGRIKSMLDEMMFKAARQGLAQVQAAAVLEKLYQSMDYKGALLLPFAPGETGLDTVQRLVRYWQGSDGGSFMVSRVDLPEGGHVIVARKLEPRVDLWLRPKEGGKVWTNETRLFAEPRSRQEAILRDAGFSEEDLARFRSAGLRVKHSFGEEFGGKLYVSVRRSHAKALKRFGAEGGYSVEQSVSGYSLHLRTSGPVQGVDKAWALGFDGAGGRIYDIDTGLDTTHPDFAGRGLMSIDFVNEGPEDWVGHGSHKAGISYADGSVYRGMAPKAEGRMGKVFSQNGFGASDGDIMAAAMDAMQWDADVISLSLGSPGTVDAPLAKFFSDLSRKKNSRGHFPIITASAGNAGPFNETRSQPSSGEFVTTVTAAAKSEDDGVPEISFYSSVGPVIDRRWSRARWRRPYGLTALGGDVTTPPGVADVYEHGIESVKSKDMPAGVSDAPDGKHTRMSGTSMSNPMVAAIALLVKQAALKVLKEGTPAHRFFMENLPQAVTLVLMRSSKDMGVPLFFQEGGFVDAEAAVRLAVRTFGGELLSLPRRIARLLVSAGRSSLAAVSEASAEPWDWVSRAQAVWALEDKPYLEAEAARKSFLDAKKKAEPSAASEAPIEDAAAADAAKGELGDQANVAFDRAFTAARTDAAAGLTKALKDEVWLVRFYAAFALANHKTPEAAVALVEAALSDPEPRVRQAAFLALAEAQSYAADEALRAALADSRPDVRMYSAYALARHGDESGLARLTEAAGHEDKRVRMSAVWLLGRLGTRAPPSASDALSARAVNEKERGNVRHVAVASLTEIASNQPGSVTNETILGLLAASGPQNFALTRTIAKFFAAVSRSPDARRRISEEPLKGAVVDFINKFKAYANHEGALGQMVRLLARVVNVPLDLPTPLPDPHGAGVPGVDSALGAVHLIVELPEGGARIARFQDFRGLPAQNAVESAQAYGLDAETIQRHDAALQAAMPLSQTLWMNVPAAKVTALRAELEGRGFKVSRAGPMYRFLKETGPLSDMPAARESRSLTGEKVLVAYLDEGGDTDHPAIPRSRIASKRNFVAEEGGAEDVESESVSHGTHGMGIVGGQSVDGSPYVGMAPGVRFAVGKVLGAQGGSEATVMAGLEWAASLSADPLKDPVVVNLSLGGPGSPDSAMGRLVNKLRLKNIFVIAAAGNEGPMEGTVGSPANAPLAVSVGAVDKKRGLTDYSSRGARGERLVSWLDFGGGVFFGLPNPYEIVSALNRRLAEAMGSEPTAVRWKDQTLYHYMSGTSMAAPHTTGKMALLIERMVKAYEAAGRTLPNGYTFYLEDLVERTAEPVAGGVEAVGAGLMSFEKALAAMDSDLKDLDAVAARSKTMYDEADKKYGDQPAAPAAPQGWFTKLFSSVLPRAWASVWGGLTLFIR
ncbi:MAG: S8 family serine peptidase [Elusimicrobia bacterium]|nr:S8 family serine peptidase [Elusimicrobiota bacterium]